jgi:hypothetical protein
MIKDTLLKLFKLDGLVNNLTGYVETRLELLKYEIKEDVARAIARASVYAMLVILLSMVVLFLSVTAALKLAEYLGMTAGFAIVGGFYGVVTAILLTVREKLSKKIEDGIKKHFKK